MKLIPFTIPTIEEANRRIGVRPDVSFPSSFVGPTPPGARLQPKPLIAPGMGRAVVFGAAKLAKDVAQATAQSGGSFVLSGSRAFGGPDELTIDESAPKWLQVLHRTIFGDKPVESIEKRVDFATEQGKQIQKKYDLPKGTPSFFGLVGGSLAALDFTGLGGEEAAVKILAKLTKTEDVANVLRKLNVAEDVITEYAPILAKTKTEAEVSKALATISDLQKTTKAGKAAIEGADLGKAGTRERGFVTSVKEELPQLETKVAGQYVPRSTDELATKARNLIKDDINTAIKLAAAGTDDKAVATASELIKHYADLAAKEKNVAVADVLNQKSADVANDIARKLTEQGRSVQAASILGRLTPEGQVRFAAREIQKYNEGAKIGRKIPELTGDQAKKIADEMKAIQDMPDGPDKVIRFNNLQNYVSDLVPSSLMDRIVAVWKAGLLTGLKTTGTNIFANVSHFGSEVLKDIPAKAVDSVASLFTGTHTIGGVTLKGTKGGLKEGFEKGIRYIKTGYDETNIGVKLDYNRVNFGKGKVGKAIQAYEEFIFHSLGAQDQPFYYGAKARSLMDQARAAAHNAGLKGEEASSFANKLIANPDEKMLYYAVRDAETATFRNQTELSKAAKKIQDIGGGAGNLAVPFSRTPSAVAMQIINYSPAGIITTLVEQVRLGKFDQRLFSQGMGRAITGTGVLFLGGELFKKGLMTLDRPTGEREQKLWELEGRKANSIKIGDKWRSIQVLGPLGNVLLVGGHFKQVFATSGSPSEAIAKALAGSWKSFTEQTFLTGISTLVSAITDPERSAATWFRSTLGSVVPTIVADVARSSDTKERRTGGILDTLKSRIPGLRQLLEPRVDVLGQEIDRIGNPLEVMADPTRPQGATATPVISELRRLTDAGFAVSPTLLGDKNGYKGLTTEENTELWKTAGQIINDKLDALFKSDQYQQMDDEQKGKAVEQFVDKAKVNARAAMAIQLTDGLEGDQLKNRLSELKKAGLLTNEVFNQYLKLR